MLDIWNLRKRQHRIILQICFVVFSYFVSAVFDDGADCGTPETHRRVMVLWAAVSWRAAKLNPANLKKNAKTNLLY